MLKQPLFWVAMAAKRRAAAVSVRSPHPTAALHVQLPAEGGDV